MTTAAVNFSELLNSVYKNDEGLFSATITDNWMQGRTTYGGLSAALCLKAIQSQFDELPPLRSAQINFIGPVGGVVTMTVNVLRQGRSVSYIGADMSSEKGLATQAVFCFGHSRESRLNNHFSTKPDVPSIADSKSFFNDGARPAFTKNYDCLLAQGGTPFSASEEHEHFLWVRHKDQNANDMAALIGIADMPPPAVLPMFKEFAPISSMTWMMNFLSEDVYTKDRWWLMRSAAEHAANGYSSQDMQIWNSNGDLIVSGRQNVAIFY